MGGGQATASTQLIAGLFRFLTLIQSFAPNWFVIDIPEETPRSRRRWMSRGAVSAGSIAWFRVGKGPWNA